MLHSTQTPGTRLYRTLLKETQAFPALGQNRRMYMGYYVARNGRLR
jgi:hypothetical protein